VRIGEAIYEVMFIIPIITPSFFNSDKCREELEMFISREKSLGRCDLILPVYYTDSPLMNDESVRIKDELAEVIHGRNFVDWRQLRNKPLSDLKVKKQMEELAKQIRDGIKRVIQASSMGTTGSPSRHLPEDREIHPKNMQTSSQDTLIEGEPNTFLVDPLGDGKYTTITQALADAKPGDRILIRPGVYK
jgi:F-box protein 11